MEENVLKHSCKNNIISKKREIQAKKTEKSIYVCKRYQTKQGGLSLDLSVGRSFLPIEPFSNRFSFLLRYNGLWM